MKFKSCPTLLLAVLALLFSSLNTQAQISSWDWQFPITANYGAFSTASVAGANGHFYLLGPRNQTLYVWELDGDGRFVQGRDLLQYAVTSLDGFKIMQNRFGGLTTFERVSPANNTSKVRVYDPNWNLIWSATSPSAGGLSAGGDITPTADKGYMICGVSSSGLNRGWLTKIDSLGVVEWDSTTLSNSYWRGFGKIASTPDGNVVVAAPYPDLDTMRVQKRSLDATLLWEAGERSLGPSRISIDGDGATWLLGINADTGQNHYRLTRIDSLGNLLFSKDIPKPTNIARYEIKVFPQGGGFIVGNSLDLTYHLVIRVDGSGDEMWRRQFGVPDNFHFYEIDTTQDNGCFVSGFIDYNSIGSRIPYAYRIDSLGNFPQNLVSGTAYFDKDKDCIRDSNEFTIPNVIIHARPDEEFALTDTAGNYSMSLDSGLASLSIYSPWVSGFLPLCYPTDSISLNLPSWQDTIQNIDLPIALVDSCPRMQVEITGMVMRVCATTNLVVNYTNISGDSIANAYVDVTFDPALTFLSAQLPHTMVGPQTYRFDLPTTYPFQQGTFFISAQVDCNATLGQSICNTAHIVPDSGCPTINPLWTGASLKVTGECLPGDTIHFKVENTGSGNMSSPTSFIIVEDDVLRMSGDIQLVAGGDTSFYIPGNGSTWACFVDQVPFHPYNSIPRAFVEGCGLNGGGTFSIGHVNSHQQDDLEAFHAVHCQVATNSCDPNDKTANPAGTLADHRISSTDHLEYVIRFQNIGNDTAYRVVVRDQIPPELDMSTFTMLGNSHPFSVQFYPDRVVEWVFDPIALVDSLTNEALSQGFVKFGMDQAPGNLPGTRIENEAEIYFDYNGPIVTNVAWNTIYDSFDSLLTVEIDEPPLFPGNPLEVFPNPVQTSVHFRFSQHGYPELRFELFDLNGRRLMDQQYWGQREFTISREGLPSGILLFRISAAGEQLSTGKLIFQ